MGVIKYKYVIYKRAEKYLVFFPDIPYWFKTTEKGVKLIEEANHFESVYELNTSDKSKKKLECLLEKIEKASILAHEKCKRINLEYIEIFIEGNFKSEMIFSRLRENLVCFPEAKLGLIFDEKSWEESIQKIKEEVDEEILDKLAYCELPTVDCTINNSPFLDMFQTIFINVESVQLLKENYNEIYKVVGIFNNQDIVIKLKLRTMEELKEAYNICLILKCYISPMLSFNIKGEGVSLLECVLVTLDFKEKYIYKYNVLNRFCVENAGILACKTCCQIGCDKIYIGRNGSVYTCEDASRYQELSVGNLLKESLLDIWYKSKKMREFRALSVEKFEHCKDCIVRYFCGGQCRIMAYSNARRMDAPIGICKEIQQIYINAMWEK